jgi:hypothetical protein
VRGNPPQKCVKQCRSREKTKKSGPELFTGPFFLPFGSTTLHPISAVSAAKPHLFLRYTGGMHEHSGKGVWGMPHPAEDGIPIKSGSF